MTHLLIFMLFTAALSGAFFYRARGGSLMTLPRPVEQILFCLVFGAVMSALTVPFLIQIVSYVAAVGIVLSGHGQYFLKKFTGSNLEAIEPETLDPVLLPFFGRDPRTDEKYAKWWGYDPTKEPEGEGMTHDAWKADMELLALDVEKYGHTRLFWRCVAGFSVTGGLVALFPGLAIAIFTPYIAAGLAIALSGFVAKPLAYIVSYYAGRGTEGGEWGYGALQWFIPVLAAILVLA